MRVVEIPHYLDETGFESVVRGLQPWPPPERLLFDARGVKWVTPFGFTALLTAGQVLRALGASGAAATERPRLTMPEDDDVLRYWGTIGFLHHAGDAFELHGRVPRRTPSRGSDVLLPVTPVTASDDVHLVVEQISEHAAEIFASRLGITRAEALQFPMVLSEACQNVVEHAESGGWVAAQVYDWRKRLGRRVAVIAVSDGGVGFRQSLEASQAKKIGARWGDGAALEAAVLHSVSRYPDPGRGQGIAGIRRYLEKWEGRLSVRSGTARITLRPAWDDAPPEERGLPFFPGAQVQIVVPAKKESGR